VGQWKVKNYLQEGFAKVVNKASIPAAVREEKWGGGGNTKKTEKLTSSLIHGWSRAGQVSTPELVQKEEHRSWRGEQKKAREEEKKRTSRGASAYPGDLEKPTTRPGSAVCRGFTILHSDDKRRKIAQKAKVRRGPKLNGKGRLENVGGKTTNM